MTATLSPAATDGSAPNKPLPVAGDDYQFRAPRHGDLVVCPYCDADTFTCDHCGGEGVMFAADVFGRAQ